MRQMLATNPEKSNFRHPYSSNKHDMGLDWDELNFAIAITALEKAGLELVAARQRKIAEMARNISTHLSFSLEDENGAKFIELIYLRYSWQELRNSLNQIFQDLFIDFQVLYFDNISRQLTDLDKAVIFYAILYQNENKYRRLLADALAAIELRREDIDNDNFNYIVDHIYQYVLMFYQLQRVWFLFDKYKNAIIDVVDSEYLERTSNYLSIHDLGGL